MDLDRSSGSFDTRTCSKSNNESCQSAHTWWQCLAANGRVAPKHLGSESFGWKDLKVRTDTKEGKSLNGKTLWCLRPGSGELQYFNRSDFHLTEAARKHRIVDEWISGGKVGNPPPLFRAMVGLTNAFFSMRWVDPPSRREKGSQWFRRRRVVGRGREARKGAACAPSPSAPPMSLP